MNERLLLSLLISATDLRETFIMSNLPLQPKTFVVVHILWLYRWLFKLRLIRQS